MARVLAENHSDFAAAWAGAPDRRSLSLRFNLPVGKISIARRGVNLVRARFMRKDAAVSSTHWKAFADRRRDPETKREAVLQTAAQLFLEKSYGRTSMNDVADRLNITK